MSRLSGERAKKKPPFYVNLGVPRLCQSILGLLLLFYSYNRFLAQFENCSENNQGIVNGTRLSRLLPFLAIIHVYDSTERRWVQNLKQAFSFSAVCHFIQKIQGSVQCAWALCSTVHYKSAPHIIDKLLSKCCEAKRIIWLYWVVLGPNWLVGCPVAGLGCCKWEQHGKL